MRSPLLEVETARANLEAGVLRRSLAHAPFLAERLVLGGDLFVAYTKSSPAIYPTAAAAVSRAASPSSFTTELIIAAGQTSYLFPPNNRWGDYSAAAPDPTDPAGIWVTAEYQASAADPADWGTATAKLRVATRTPIVQVPPASPPPR